MNEFIDIANKIGAYLVKMYVQVLPTLETFSLVVIGVLVFFVGIMMGRLKTLGMKRDKFIDKWGLGDLSKMKIKRAWKELVAEVGTGASAKMKKAINDADKMVDEALKGAGFVGKNMDERLAKVDDLKIANIKEVREAHRMSERIKKEPTLVITSQMAWNIVEIYQKALKDLGLLK